MIKLLINDGEYSEELINYCPICETITNFKPFGTPPRKNAQCSNRGSLERDKFSIMIFHRKIPQIFEKNCKFLHFAPEKNLYKIFNNQENIDYYPVDINPKRYKKNKINIREKVNMENIPYEDNTFDFIYNSHVLEHVPDDIKAMGQLRRVLKEDGICLVTIPLFNIPKTLENEEYNTPELRLKHYGQKNHLRKYGNDFKNRLESVGFDVEEVEPKDIENNINKRKILGLNENEKFFICKK